MSSVFESCEQQFAQITAEVSSRIIRVPSLLGDDRKTEIKLIESNIDEAREQVEQMELEVTDMPAHVKGKMAARVKSYKNELTRLQRDFKEKKLSVSATANRRELFGRDEEGEGDEQKEQLLSNSDRLRRTGDMIEESYQITIESERVGMSVMDDLNRDREKIQQSQRRLRETNEDITRSGRILSRIGRRVMQHKIIFAVAILVVLVIIALLIFAIVKIKQSADGQQQQ